MKEDANQRLVEGHRHIVAFLKNWQERLDSFIQHKKQQKLLQYAIDNGLYPYKEANKRLKKDIGETRSARSKVKSALNESLRKFCKDYQITPPIQLYFVSAKLRKQIIHFACCRSEKTGRAAEYVSLDKLQETLIKAYQLLVEDSKEKHAYEGSKIIESVIKQLLRDEALLHLREKLRPRDEGDYKPLQLDCGLIRSDEDQKDKLNHNRKWGSFDFNDLLKPFGICVLACDVGTGKTTFLRHLQLELLQRTDFIPVFVHARKIEEWKPENSSDFAKYLAESFHSQQQEIQVRSFLEDAFNNKNQIVLMVDGLDQIRGVGTEYKQLIKNVLKLTDNNLIIASRPSAVAIQEEEENLTFLRLKPFDTNTQKSYFGEHYKRARELSANATDLIAIPMLAYMVRTLIEKKQDKNIKHHTELYKRFIDYILEEYEHEEVKQSKDDQMRARQSLRRISYDALAEEQPWIQKIPLEFCYEHDRLALESDKLTKFGLVNLIVERTAGIDDYLYFTHQSFQEYLAAEWAMKNEERIQQVLNEMWKPKWRGVIKFLAGLLGENFIRRIYSPACKDNCIHSRLFLAAECCSESTATAEAEKAVLEQLKGLICEPLFMKDALTSLSKLNSPEAIDVLVSVATCTFSNIPNTVRKKWQSLAITGIPRAKAEIRSEHVDAFVGAIQRSDKIIYDEMLDMVVELVRTLTPSQIDRIVDTVCSCGAAGSYSKKGGAPLLKRLTGTHIEKVFRLIADNDEALKRRALDILDWLTENWTRHAEPRRLPLSTQHIDALVRSAESGSFTVKVGVFNVLTNLITEPIVSSSHIDWIVHVITRVIGFWPGLAKLTCEMLDIFPYRLSSSQRSQIIDLVFHEDLFLQMRGTWFVRDCLADSLLEEEVTRIISILHSDSSAPWLKRFFGHVLVRASHRLASSHLDQIIDLLMTRDEIAVPTAVDVLSRVAETVTMNQKQVKRILEAIGAIDGDFGYNPRLWDGETTPSLYFRWSLQPIAVNSAQENITKIVDFLDSGSSFQQKVGIALLTSLGNCLPDECIGRIVKLLSQGTPVVIEGALEYFYLVPEKLSAESITRVIDCLSNPYIRVRDLVALCLRKVADRLSTPHIAKIAGLLDRKNLSVANMALVVLAAIPDRVPDEAIAKVISMLGRQKYEYYHPSIIWRDVRISSFIASFGARFGREHIFELVEYMKGRRRFLKEMALDILAKVEQHLPSDVFYELIEYLTARHRRVYAMPRELFRSTSHPLKKQHVHRIVRCFGRTPNSWVMRQKISEIPPRLLAEHIGFFVELLNHQNPFAQVNSLAILAYLVDKLHPRHIKRVERLLCSSDEEVQTDARKFLEKTYQLRGLPC